MILIEKVNQCVTDVGISVQTKTFSIVRNAESLCVQIVAASLSAKVVIDGIA